MAQLPSQFDRYAENTDLIQALLESGLSIGSEAFADLKEITGTYDKNPILGLRGSGNKEAAEEFTKRQEANRPPTYTPTQQTQDIQKAIMEQYVQPTIDKVGELGNTWAARNPNEAESVGEYFKDPRVKQTGKLAAVAAPIWERLGRVLMDANFGQNLKGGGGGNQKGIIKIFEEEDLTRHGLFEDESLIEAFNQNPKSREILMSMTPDEFKQLAYPMDSYKDVKTDKLRESLVNRGELLRDIPQLWFENKLDQPARVTGHEGRHRAEILDQLGMENIPVRFISTEHGDAPAIRWGQQDYQNPDLLHPDDYPTELISEGNLRSSVPFPIERPLGNAEGGRRTPRPDRSEFKGKTFAELTDNDDWLFDSANDFPLTKIEDSFTGGKQRGAISMFDGSSDRGTLHDLQVAMALNQYDRNGMPATNTLPGKYDNIIDSLTGRALNYDPRIDRNSAQRVGTKDRMQSLEMGFDTPAQNVDPLSIFDQEGKGAIFTMSDRLSAQGNVTSVRGVPLNFPINVQGGQGNMFVPENVKKGQAWGSHDIPIGHMQNLAIDLKKQTGQDPLLMPWRMSPAAVDFNPRVGQLMMSYAQANMSPDTKTALNKSISDFRSVGKWDKDQQKQVGDGLFIADFKGIDSPEAYKQFEQAPDSLRKELKLMMDKEFRDKGGLGIGEARLVLTDPTQMNAPDAGLQNVARIDTGRPMIEGSGQPAYAKGLYGEGMGELTEEINPYDFGIGKNTFKTDIDAVINELVKSRNINPRNPTANDNRALMMKPYGGIITDEVLRGME